MASAATLRREHADNCDKCRNSMDIHETSNCKAARDLDQQIRQAERQTSKPQPERRQTRRQRRYGPQPIYINGARAWCMDCGDVATTYCNDRLHHVS